MSNTFEFTDRYKATGTPYPNPETMCEGPCEGMGIYPHKLGDEDETPQERELWQAAHDALNSHDESGCDGWHFIKCSTCNGTGKRIVKESQ